MNTLVESDEVVIKKLCKTFQLKLKPLIRMSKTMVVEAPDKSNIVYKFDLVKIDIVDDEKGSAETSHSFCLNRVEENLDECTSVYKTYSYYMRGRLLADESVYNFFKVLSDLLKEAWSERLFLTDEDYYVFLARDKFLDIEKDWVIDFDTDLFKFEDKIGITTYKRINDFSYDTYKFNRPYHYDKSSKMKHSIFGKLTERKDLTDEVMKKARLMCIDGLLSVNEIKEIIRFTENPNLELNYGEYLSQDLLEKVAKYES
jgi:hypothetical protein